jgi:hypothetical protein
LLSLGAVLPPEIFDRLVLPSSSPSFDTGGGKDDGRGGRRRRSPPADPTADTRVTNGSGVDNDDELPPRRALINAGIRHDDKNDDEIDEDDESLVTVHLRCVSP